MKNVLKIINDLYFEIDQLLIDSYVLNELCTIIDKRMIAKEDTISIEGLCSIIRQLRRKENKIKKPKTTGFNLKKIERRVILRTLKRTEGNQKEAAKLLGISNRALNYKIHKIHKIDEFVWKKNKENVS